jgi:hypothetical protein
MQSHYRRNKNYIKADEIQAVGNSSGIREGDNWYFFGCDPAASWNELEKSRYTKHDFLDTDFSINIKDIYDSGFFDEYQNFYWAGPNLRIASPTNRTHHDIVAPGFSFIQIMSPQNAGIGLKADGTVWGWGNNYHGQLGDGHTLSRSSPVSLLGDHSFVDIFPISYPEDGTIAKKANGELWMWGSSFNSFLYWSGGSFSSPMIIRQYQIRV